MHSKGPTPLVVHNGSAHTAGPSTTASTRSVLLDVAQRLMQARGYSAVSYTDIAAAVGIRAASIHHHFPSKADLGLAVVTRYTADFLGRLADIQDQHAAAATRLGAYTAVMGAALQDDDRLCLCTILAADLDTLPDPVRAAVADFALANQRWLTDVLSAGGSARELRSIDDASAEAQILFAEVQGAQLIARALGDPRIYETIAERLLDRLTRTP